MAIVYPPIGTIKKLRQKPTAGELYLLDFLIKNLDDSYEIFFQPFLNGDIPDIIIMRKGSGVYIIEVKDWDLKLYDVDEKNKRNWYVTTKNNRQMIGSPIQQVYRYKENLYNLHIAGLLEKKIRDPRLLRIVNCGIYFHNSRTNYVNEMVSKEFELDKKMPNKYQSYLRFLNYFDLFGHDSLTPEKFQIIMSNRWMNQTSYLFSEDLYQSFKRHLKPPKHVVEQGIDITYSKEQKKIIESAGGFQQKVKGVAGSGKTLCLAKRVVNAHKRHHEPVLILTFNIALRNYIKDKINEVREDFYWNNFHIVHYHEFFKNQANNHNLKLSSNDDWSNVAFFEDVKNAILSYKTVVIDEIQDYRNPWVGLIRKYFLENLEPEYVVYGDEKQNIYQRAYDEKERKPYTGIGGQWNLLKRSYRVTNDIGRLAEAFQKKFFFEKYELDEIEIQKSFFEKSEVVYKHISSYDSKIIIDIYKEFANKHVIHENDICFQCAQVRPLREIDQKLRLEHNQQTNTMFETQEIYDKLLSDFGLNLESLIHARNLAGKSRTTSLNEEELMLIKSYQAFQEAVDKVRRNKKFNYWNNRGVVKLSTIHSFKGWEVDTLLLIILKEDNHKEFESAELIYTAITRCRTNLIVINCDNEKYHKFFSTNSIAH